MLKLSMLRLSMQRLLSLVALSLALALPLPVRGTWSIVVCNQTTKEVGIASVTCLTSFNLLAITPVVRVGEGAGAVQAAGDFDGIRRPIIRTGLINETDPQEILNQLMAIAGHEDRQYGIVDTLGRAVTFSGALNADWAGGVTGNFGDFYYAIQGNILAGGCVVPAAEAALLTTPGDLPTRLMAAMQAARFEGGDGRCSCNPGAATICGCPPPSFTKSGHIGYLVVARIGDSNDLVCNASGCADGNYLYKLNVANQTVSALDPVAQLQNLFNSRRTVLAGRPDAIASTQTIAPVAGGAMLTLSFSDYDGAPVTLPLTVTVAHELDSDGVAVIGTPVDLGGGVFEVFLGEGTGFGVDRLRLTGDDGFRSVTLMPSPSLCWGSLATGASDCNGNGIADPCDLFSGTSADLDEDGFLDECTLFSRGDCNADGTLNIADAVSVLEYLFLPAVTQVTCREACNSGGGDQLDIADGIHLLSYVFGIGSPPPSPFPDCGTDETPTPIDCADSTFCP